MTEILGCPFCGETSDVVGTHHYTRHGRIPIIECANCGAVFTLRKYVAKRGLRRAELDDTDLYKAWNRRAD